MADTGDHDELERIWPTPGTEEEYRKRCPADFGRYDFALRFVERKRVLDCACGAGYGSWLLAKGGARSVIGVDVSSDAIAWANEYFHSPNLEFRARTDSRLPVADGSVDQIVSLETLEHVDDPAAFVKELARAATPGAGLVLSTPLTTGPERFKPLNKYHVREFNADELSALISPCFVIHERLGQHSHLAAKFAGLRRSPILGHAIRRGFHRALPDSLREAARTWLGRRPTEQPVWISQDGWQDAPVQIIIAQKS